MARPRRAPRGTRRVEGRAARETPPPQVYGCVCDEPYDAVFNCAFRKCPHGDDPLTTGQSNEIQYVKCMATGGTFTLYLNGAPSGDIRAGMKAHQRGPAPRSGGAAPLPFPSLPIGDL